jgi:hypothetical protein
MDENAATDEGAFGNSSLGQVSLRLELVPEPTTTVLLLLAGQLTGVRAPRRRFIAA